MPLVFFAPSIHQSIPLRTDASKKGRIHLHKDFSDLVVYTASVPVFQGYDNALRLNKCWTMTSFGEKRLEEVRILS
jgi:hypothetical protein